tara:strand:+ start:1214 stop:1732 length:519 start_codon:yes stop_codon:yes gene_type:complete
LSTAVVAAKTFLETQSPESNKKRLVPGLLAEVSRANRSNALIIALEFLQFLGQHADHVRTGQSILIQYQNGPGTVLQPAADADIVRMPDTCIVPQRDALGTVELVHQPGDLLDIRGTVIDHNQPGDLAGGTTDLIAQNRQIRVESRNNRGDRGRDFRVIQRELKSSQRNLGA